MSLITRSVFMFCTRVLIFWIAQIVFYLGPARACRELPLMDDVAITSACVLSITIVWLIWEIGKMMYKGASRPFHNLPTYATPANDEPVAVEEGHAELLESINANSKRRGSELYSSAAAPATAFQENHALNNTSYTSMQSGRSRYTTTGGRRVRITPWILWYYVHAIGIIIFVLTYSISGLSSLPCITLIGTITLCSATTMCDQLSKARGIQAFWTVCMLCAYVLLLVDNIIEMDAYIWMLALASHLWMGFVLPVGSCVFLFQATRRMNFVHLTPYEMIAFTLPSLAMLSSSFLSLYMPSGYTRLVSQNASSTLALIYSYYDNATATNATSTIEQYLQAALLNASSAAETDHRPLMAVTILLTLLCPLLLFMLMVMFLASFTSRDCTQSNVTAFALATIFRRFFTSSRMMMRSWPLLAALASVLCASLAIVYFEHGCRCAAAQAQAQDDDDDEQAGEEIAFQRKL